MKLSHYKKANLDARYTSYDPEQELENEESEVNLCCAIHGPYTAKSKHLMRMHLKRTLRSAKCPGCRKDKLSDREYLATIKRMLRAFRGDEAQQMFSPPHPDWQPAQHWTEPNVLN